MRKGVSLLLSVVLLLSLAACGGTSGDGSAQAGPEETEYKPITSAGRYVEEDITPEPLKAYASGAVQKVYAWEEESLDLLGFYSKTEEAPQETYYWYHSEDRGESWEERQFPEDWGNIQELYLDRQGGLYGLCMDGDQEYTLRYRGPNQEDSSVPVEVEGVGGFAGEGYYISCRQDREQNTSELCCTDARTGQALWSYQLETPDADYGVLEDRLYVESLDNDRYHDILDLATGEKLGEFDQKNLSCDVHNFLSGTEQFYFWMDGSGNLCRGIFGHDQTEVVLETDQYRYATEAGGFNGEVPFAISPEQVIYLDISGALNNSAARLYRYQFDSDARYGEKQLTIWTLNDSDTVRNAVMYYQEAHPEVNVVYQVQSEEMAGADSEEEDSGEEGQTLNDLLTVLNTKLLAGDGPDVLILDGTNWESYRAKGVLASLDDIYGETEFVGQVASALLDKDGTCQVIPTRFSVPVLFGDGVALAKNLESFVQQVKAYPAVRPSAVVTMDSSWGWREETPKPQLSKEGFDWEHRPYLDTGDEGELLELMWNTCAPSLFDEDGVREEQLREWMKCFYDICQYYGYFRQEDRPLALGTSWSGADSSDYGNRCVKVTEAASGWASGYGLAGATQLDSVELFPVLLKNYQFNTERTAQAFQLAHFPGQAEGAYTPMELMAVNAGSQDQEEAKEFIRTALSMDVQKYTYGDGLPVLQEAMEQQIAYFQDETAALGGDLTELWTLFDGLDTPSITEPDSYQAVVGALQEYCFDRITLDEAVEQVKSDLSVKMMER